ncbi:hypothetical protein [Mariniphaga sediminis]|uniref:hypothetical protein n=1 Tax=Mariniphaga sediminis TaxID=1628158 RepID=UPI003569ED9D
MKKEDFLKIVRSNSKKDLSEQEVSFLGSMGEAIEQAFQADSVTRKKDIENLTGMLGSFDEGETVSGVIRSLAQKVDEMEQKAKRGLSANDKFKLRQMLDDKKDEIKAARNTNSAWAIEFRAVRAASAAMTTSTVVTGASAINNPNFFEDMELVVIKYPANFIIDAIGGRQVAKVPNQWGWKEQADESDGDAAAVLEGGTKPLTDKSFVWKYATRKKYAGRIEFSMEMEMDFDQLFLEIVNMFEQQVIRAWNTGVQTDLMAWVPSYTSTELDGYYVQPNVAQVIEAGKLHVSDNNYDADIVLINPADAAKAMIHQNADGDVSYLPSNVAFGGLTPFVSNKVPAGTIVVGTTGIVQEQHSSFILRRGVYGDQLISNEETIIGEVFSNLKLPTRSKVGWVKMDVDTVLAALKKGV